MEANKKEYEQMAKEIINEHLKKHERADAEMIELEEQILNLKIQNQCLEKDKEKICSFISKKISSVYSVIGSNELSEDIGSLSGKS